YTVVANFPGSADYAANSSAPVNFTIGRATATVALNTSNGSTVFGQPVNFVATVNAAGIPRATVTFFDGTSPLGTVTLDGSGRATLTVSTLSTGSHSISASYSGDADRIGGMSEPATESVARAGTQVVLVRHRNVRRKQVVSVGLMAEIRPLSPGAGSPTGTVK